ncbi:putative Acyl-coenzyme A thioesterase 13 [Glarea lozoyensis 74030]|nr:putative Acyl-coenzyme A thioesterase 13 [Glarea lozoyensis 74030]
MLSEDVELISASATPVGSSICRFTVKPKHCNRLNNLHGGCTATLFDWLTTSALAPIAKPGYWQYAGVSRTLNVTYIKPVPVGETVLVECSIVHAGRRLCTINGIMKRESTGEVLAICEHGKVSIDPEVPKI